MKKYDVIILGAGAAGLTAAIYAARYGLSTLVLSKDIGGTANLAEIIENYPGFSGSGIELMKKFSEQARTSGAEIMIKEVVDIEKQENFFKIKTKDNNIFEARAVIIAIGTEKRKLNINGEKRFLGKGLSYCAICDSPLFRNKKVAVMGGSDAAAHSALLLSKYAKNIVIVYRKAKLRCEAFLLAQIKKEKNIQIIYNAVPIEIKGKNVVDSLVIEQQEKKRIRKILSIDGIFVEIGGMPSTSIAKKLGIKLDKQDYIIVDNKMCTPLTGVFAAGDIVSDNIKQIVTAAAQGAIAASSAYKFLKEKKEKV